MAKKIKIWARKDLTLFLSDEFGAPEVGLAHVGTIHQYEFTEAELTRPPKGSPLVGEVLCLTDDRRIKVLDCNMGTEWRELRAAL